MTKTFVMTDDALENYGEEWRDIELTPIHTASKYMPSQEFYQKDMLEGYHPGYDESMEGMKLYDLKRIDTDEELMFSLYEWELEEV